jgi:hypothetical protein
VIERRQEKKDKKTKATWFCCFTILINIQYQGEGKMMGMVEVVA